MRYKENTRSPQYGKIFMKDENGRVEEVMDVLRVVVSHKGRNYTIKELLEEVANNQTEVAKISDLEAALKTQKETIRDLKKLVVLLDAQIKSLKKH